jgi:hypothetical protein
MVGVGEEFEDCWSASDHCFASEMKSEGIIKIVVVLFSAPISVSI